MTNVPAAEKIAPMEVENPQAMRLSAEMGEDLERTAGRVLKKERRLGFEKITCLYWPWHKASQ